MRLADSRLVTLLHPTPRTVMHTFVHPTATTSHQTTSGAWQSLQYRAVECVLTGHCKTNFVQCCMQFLLPESLQLGFLAA